MRGYVDIDNAGRLSSIDYNLPGAALESTYTYTYTTAGRIAQRNYADNMGYNSTNAYAYDRLGRLTSDYYSDNNWYQTTSSWSYDRYGNAAGLASSANNRLTAFASNYDNAGNLLQDTNNGYSFNAENRTIQAIRRSDGAQLGAYRYDALDRKVKVSWNLGPNNYGSYVYIYGTHNEILQENKNSFDGTNLYVLSTMNVYMGTTMVGKRTIGTISYATQVDTIQWLHRNHRQEVIYTETLDHTDPLWYANGPIVTSYGSGAFSGDGSDQYPGQKIDEQTGLKDFGARYYNPSLMRWTSPDPATAHIYDPQSLNKYTYVRNDPVNLVDPDGRSWISAIWGAIKSWLTSESSSSDYWGPLMGAAPSTESFVGTRTLPPMPTMLSGVGGAPPLVQALIDSIARVQQDLLTDKCGKDFKNAGDTSTMAGTVTYANTGDPQFIHDPTTGKIVSVQGSKGVGEYDDNAKSIVLNLSVSWTDPNNTIGMIDGSLSVIHLLAAQLDALGPATTSTITAAQYMDLTILHELSHYNGAIGNPDKDPTVEQNLWKDCIKPNP